MKNKCHSALAVLALFSLVAGCTVTTPSSPAPGPIEKAEARPAWQETWDMLVAAARSVGKVVIYGNVPAQTREDLSKAFKQKYGIDLEFMAGKAAELMAKMKMERRARIYVGDLGLLGLGAYLSESLREITDPVEPLLILPEVKDTGKWFQGKLPLVDREGHAFALVMAPTGQTIFNSDAVKEGEVSGVRDFLNAKWKGNIAFPDPSTTGTALSWYKVVLKYILGIQDGRAYMRELSTNVAVISGDYRQLTEWVARGKYALAIGMRPDEPTQFIQMGAPIKFMASNEQRMLTPLWALLNVFTDRAHPDATRLFVNWLLSREGLSTLSRSSMLPTARIDVVSESIKSISPVLLPRSNDISTSEELEADNEVMMRMAKEDFANLLK